MNGPFGIYRTNTPGLFIDGKINDQVVVTDNSWKCYVRTDYSIVPEASYFAPVHVYENCKGNKADLYFLKEEIPSEYEQVKVCDEEEISTPLKIENLAKRTVPFMYRRKCNFLSVQEIKESNSSEKQWNNFLQGKEKITIAPNTKEVVEISAGQETTGYLYLNLARGANTKITLLQSEAYVTDEQVPVNGLSILPVKEDRTDSKYGHLEGYVDTYRVNGYGDIAQPEIYNPFWFRTFRYIRLAIATSDTPLDLISFNYEDTGYPLEVNTKVTTSDPSLDEIWKLDRLTLQRCMHETYEDCPFYEQLQYVMDTRAQILFTYNTAADDRLAREAIDAFRRSQYEDGLLNAAYPSYEKNIIPGFSIYYILMLHDHMMYFGDKKLLMNNWSAVTKVLDFFKNNLTKYGYVGVIGGLNVVSDKWSFIDWAKEWSANTGVPLAIHQGPLVMESLLYLYGLEKVVEIADFLGKKEEAKTYQKQIIDLKAALRKYCLGENGMLQDGPGVDQYSQHCQVFGLLTGVLSKSEGRKNILETIKHKDKYAQCSIAMSFYLFEALKLADLYEYTDQYWNIWRKMLKNNCTTSIEAEVGDRSECHAWGAIALYELPSVILGVHPSAPGYREVEIKPTPGYLNWAKGEVKTPKGIVKVDWQLKNGKLNLNYKVPDGMNVKKG